MRISARKLAVRVTLALAAASGAGQTASALSGFQNQRLAVLLWIVTLFALAYSAIGQLIVTRLQRLGLRNLNVQAKLADDLQDLVRGHAWLDLTFATRNEEPTARLLLDAFITAGWKHNQLGLPLEGYVKFRVPDGIQVSGVSERLVAGVADALETAGLRQVRKQILERRISPQNPKYELEGGTIRMVMGREGSVE
jgi:hypothetical protein